MAVSSNLEATSLGCSLAAIVCACRVFEQGLAKRYPAFTSYLISQSLMLVFSSLADLRSALYTWTFIVAYPITWVIYCLMVGELYNKIFVAYPGIATFGRWSVYLAAAFASVEAIASSAATRGILVKKSILLIPLEVAGRNIVFGLAFSIIILLFLISRYPLSLHRNVLVNCILFSTSLLAEAGILLADHLTNLSKTHSLDVLLMILNIGCFTAWSFLLTSQGARKVIHVHRTLSASEEHKLLGQLRALNALGLRSAGK